MSKLGNHTSFDARYYQAGSGESTLISVDFRGRKFVVISGNEEKSVNDLDEWDVSLGGSYKDRVSFHNSATGDTMIVRDLKVLDCLAQGSGLPMLAKQAAKAKSQRFFNAISGTLVRLGIVCAVLFFITFCVIGIGYNIAHPSKDIESSSDVDDDKKPAYEPTGNAEQDKYIEALQDKIKKCWRPTQSSEVYDITLTFLVHEDGKVSKIRVSNENNAVPGAAQKAIEAVRKAQPFGRLPKALKPQAQIEFTLSYEPKGE